MDENLINQTVAEYDVTEDVGAQEIEVPVQDVEQEVVAEESVYDVIVEPETEVSIDVSESMGWVSGDTRYHDGLLGIDLPNQHPITAIRGLREELDKIEALKEVYSNERNVANYYKWEDASYDEYGYFVSLTPGESTIKICDGLDIFGVSVHNAGFIGGQDESTSRDKDNSYGLIATSGLVEVRCELDIEVGDYITSNSRGYATKSGSNYGYKVIALETKDGVRYAIIMLGVQADMTNALGIDLDEVRKQVEANYKNIISATNVANQAYNKASESATVSEEAVKNALEALGQSNNANVNSNNALNIASSASQAAAQANAIANAAVTSAASIKNEAVEKANEAMSETAKTRKELDESIDQVRSDINDNVDYIDQTKESLENLTKELEPLSEWQSKDGTQSGYTGFVAQSDESASELGWVSGYEYKDSAGNVISTGLAGLVSQVEKNKSEIALIVSFDQDDDEGVAALVAKVSDHDAQLQNLTTWKTEQTETVSNISQKTDKNSADIGIVTAWKNTVEDDVSSIASIQTTANENKASISTLAEKQTENEKMIAGVQVSVDENSSDITNLTSWQGEANTAMTRIEQKADANGAYIQSTVSNMDKYAVGPYSQAYGFTLEQAANVLEEGMIYVPTETKTGDNAEAYSYTDKNGETKTYKREFVKGYLYEWRKLTDYPYGWVTIDKNYNETSEINTSAQAVYFSTTIPVVSGNFGYWYTNGAVIMGNEDNNAKRLNSPDRFYTIEELKTRGASGYSASWTTGETYDNSHIFAGDTVYIPVNIVLKDGSNNAKEIVGYGAIYGVVQHINANEWMHIVSTGYIANGMTGAYEPYTLYKWEPYVEKNGVDEGRWVAVATLAGNSSNRAVSQIRQDANSIELRVTNTEGSAASSKQWIDDNSANIQDVVSWKSKNGESLVAFMQTADDNYASASQVAQIVDKDGNINVASIVTAVTSDESSIALLADNIILDASQIMLNGEATFTTTETTDSGDITKINGAHIATGTVTAVQLSADAIQSNNYDSGVDGSMIPSGDHSEAGTFMNLETGAIYTPNFSVDEAGDAYLNGIIKAKQGGEIGGFYIGEKALYNNQTSYADSNKSGVYIGIDGIGLGAGKFYVDRDGALVSMKGTVGGWNITEKALQKNTTQLLTDDSVVGDSLVNVGKKSPVRIAVGQSVETKETVMAVDSSQGYVDDEYVILAEEPIGVEIISEKDEYGLTDQFDWDEPTINGNKVILKGRHRYGPYDGEVYVTIKYTYYAPIMRLLDDGSMYSSAIKVTGGMIGGFTITDNEIKVEGFDENQHPINLNITANGQIISKGVNSQVNISYGYISAESYNDKISISMGGDGIECYDYDSKVYKWQLTNTAATLGVAVYLKGVMHIYDSSTEGYVAGYTGTINGAKFVNGICVGQG